MLPYTNFPSKFCLPVIYRPMSKAILPYHLTKFTTNQFRFFHFFNKRFLIKDRKKMTQTFVLLYASVLSWYHKPFELIFMFINFVFLYQVKEEYTSYLKIIMCSFKFQVTSIENQGRNFTLMTQLCIIDKINLHSFFFSTIYIPWN